MGVEKDAVVVVGQGVREPVLLAVLRLQEEGRVIKGRQVCVCKCLLYHDENAPLLSKVT